MFAVLRRVAPLVAIVLLTWTAADLACPSVCARDQVTASVSVFGLAGASVHSSSTDVDDCFCCARCMDTGVRIPDLDSHAAWVIFTEPVRHLAARPSALDHPPQNA